MSVATHGARDSLTLRFVDDELEERYQRAAGDESHNGFRTIALASGLLWTLLAFVLPVATSLEASVAVPIGLTMAALGLATAAADPWARTIDRQNVLSSALTTANSVVILVIGFAAE